MNCEDCEERRKLAREALINSKILEAGGHLLKGAAELVGIKSKTARADSGKKPKLGRKKQEK